MALYAVGDIQGCLDAFDQLLETISFDPRRDRLVLVGDLVNRGPDSGGVISRVMSFGDSVQCVLGNHDLNTLAIDAGCRPAKPRDTILELISSPNSREMLEWLRHRPLMIELAGYVFCHAGIYPGWSLDTASSCAREVEAMLRGPDHRAFYANMYGSEPARWDDDLAGWDRLRFITNAFTRMRYVTSDGALDFLETGPPGTQRPGLTPWFDMERRPLGDRTVVFGHWSSLGYHAANGVLGLDTGCVWGHMLTAVNLDRTPPTKWHVRCKDRQS